MKPHPMKGQRRRNYRSWTDADVALLRARYPYERTAGLARDLQRDERAVYAKAKTLRLSKDPAFKAVLREAHNRSFAEAGRASRFPKGHVPHSKGRKGWSAGGRSIATRFPKGHKPANCAPIGAERVASGFLQRKVSETGYTPRDWRGVHILNWEAVHGPLPPGHALVFRDRNRLNCAVENLELVTRQELMRRNSYHTRYPKEVGLAIHARAQLVRKINRIERERREDGNH